MLGRIVNPYVFCAAVIVDQSAWAWQQMGAESHPESEE
jgi:hypothetical protein